MRETLKNISLLLLTSLIIFLFAETLFRFYARITMNYDMEMHRYATEMKRKSDIDGLNHEHIPGTEAKLMGVNVSINSLGYRDDELPQEKGASEYRILVLGSSVTFGWGVEKDSSFTSLLQERLRIQHPKQKIEVFNAGVGNYNTKMEELVYQQLIDVVKPDMVLLHFAINDAEEIPKASQNWFIANSYLIASYYLKIKEALYSNKFESLGEYYLSTLEDEAPGWQKARSAILRISEDCAERNLKFLVLLHPDLHDFSKGSLNEKCQTIIGEFLRSNSIEFLDVFENFRTSSGDNPEVLWVTPSDPHPNQKGHKIIFETLFNHIESKKLIQ